MGFLKYIYFSQYYELKQKGKEGSDLNFFSEIKWGC